MPVIQISQIQHRRGLSTDLPNPSLAEGELGMTLDTGEVLIGAPNFPPIVGRTIYPYQNLRILTEFSVKDILTNLQYVYRDQQKYTSTGDLNPAFPGPKSYAANQGWTVERLLQERLDEVVSVKSYGATGTGILDDYVPIERACLDLYTDAFKPKKPKILYFPAGVYVINSTDALPLFAGSMWVGDGSGRTIIILKSNVRAVAETAEWNGSDIIRNSDLSIDEPINNIFISGITLARSDVGDILRLDRANKGTFLDVEFVVATDSDNDGILEKSVEWSLPSTPLIPGGWPASTKYLADEHGICVRIDRMSRLIPALDNWFSGDFNFIDCNFSSNTYGFYIVDSIENVNINGCVFDDLFKGVTLGEAMYYSSVELDQIGDLAWSLPFDKDLGQTYLDWDPMNPLPGDPGPWGASGFRVTNSVFKNIYDTPFSVFSSRFGNVSMGNLYDRYGGVYSSTPPLPLSYTPVNEAIFFYKNPTNKIYIAENNSSIGDSFYYNGPDHNKRVNSPSLRNFVSNSQTPLLTPNGMVAGTHVYLPMRPENEELTPSAINKYTGIRFNTAELNSIVIDYSISRSTGKKKGELHIITDGSNIDWYENIIEVGTPVVDFDFDVVIDGSDVVVRYTDTSIGNLDLGLLRWSARAWNHSFNGYGSI